MNVQYKDYYKNHVGYLADSRESYLMDYYNKNFFKLFQSYDFEKINVLEIGCGKWIFALYCQSLGILNYAGFDLDGNIISQNLAKQLGNGKYVFSNTDVLDFMKWKKFDLIFMSHVFEHLTPDEADRYVVCIRDALETGGMYINVMPNAGSLFSSNLWRYADSTHKTLYTEVSFSQVLLSWGFNWDSIEHRNAFSGPICLRILRSGIKKILKLTIELLGYPTSRVDTFEIVTIVKR